MCGIAGLAAIEEGARLDGAELRRMTEAIRHRGPDDDGFFESPDVALGMRRLSIIDLAGGAQPMQNEAGTVQLVYNGEVYNYRELRAELRSRHRFASCDAEVLVHAYEDDPEGFLSSLRGMFALALWDEDRAQLTLAVDRLGIKPLYFAAVGGRLIFASELASLLCADGVPSDLDWEALGQYFALGYIPPPRTIFRNVSKLAPGTVVRWTRAGGLRRDRYWDPADVRTGARFEPAALHRRLRQTLSEAVSSHLVSDVPLGAFLSGGIDSSTVVALMSEASEERVKTFSIGFGDPEHDELHLARLVAERFRTDHHEFVVEPDAVEGLPKLVSHFGEPFADSSALPTYHVSRLAREHVKAAPSGDGGDELFMGYTTFLGLELARYAQALPAPVRGLMGRAPRSVRGVSGSMSDRLTRALKVVRDTTLAPKEAYLSKITLVGQPDLERALSSEVLAQLRPTSAYEPVEAALAGTSNGGHTLDPFVHAGLKISLTGDMLMKVDRMCMANSLEVRVPLLDHVPAELALSTTVSQRFPRWRQKGLLQDVMRDTLPRQILEQRKHGFTVPTSRWFRGDLWGYVREVLLSPEARERGFPRSRRNRTADREASGRTAQPHCDTVVAARVRALVPRVSRLTCAS